MNGDQPHYVYRCYDADGRLIYVGCTVNPNRRIAWHRNSSWWGHQIDAVRNRVYPDRPTALMRERQAIAAEQPRWNTKSRWAHRDGWCAQDYRDYYRAYLLSPTQQTLPRRTHLDRIRHEATAIFGLELETGVPA